MSLSPLDGSIRTLPFPIAVIDDRGRVVELSEPLERATGRPAGELIGSLLLGELLDATPEAGQRLDASLGDPAGEVAFHGSFCQVEDTPAPSRRIRVRPFRHGDRTYAIALVDDAAGEPTDEGPSGEMLRDVFRRVSVTRHRLNNLLMGLLGQAELLRDTPDLPESARTRTETIMQQVARLQEAIQEMSDVNE